MAIPTETTSIVQPALLFMPDITGFTRFVTSTEISHAQSIVQEVLEVIVESNHINLEVGEIEGDAVFFYRLGKPPNISQLLQQVQTMFTRFHQHLKMYDQQRICPCAACASASGLQLKIVAHYGEVAGYSVQSHHKLFGKDVIILHRLLKNNLDKSEYALFTDSLMDSAGTTEQYPEWFCPEQAQETYDVGEISFKVSDLARLKQSLPEGKPEQFNTARKAITVFSEETTISAGAEKVFGAIFDLSLRPRWMEGVLAVEMIRKDLINRVGTRHRCVFSKYDKPVIVTEYAFIGDGMAELVEMDEKGMGGCRFRIEALNQEQTRITMELLVRRNPLLLAFFHLFVKRKLRRRIKGSLRNLIEFCRPSFANPAQAIHNLN